MADEPETDAPVKRVKREEPRTIELAECPICRKVSALDRCPRCGADLKGE